MHVGTDLNTTCPHAPATPNARKGAQCGMTLATAHDEMTWLNRQEWQRVQEVDWRCLHMVLFRQSALLNWDLKHNAAACYWLTQWAKKLQCLRGNMLFFCELQAVSLCPNVDLCPGIWWRHQPIPKEALSVSQFQTQLTAASTLIMLDADYCGPPPSKQSGYTL